MSIDQDEPLQKLKAHAFKLISIRPRSVSELTALLMKFSGKWQIDELLVSAVTDDLIQRKYLDDAVFVRWWIEQRDTFRPKGRQALIAELYRKGIDRTVVDRVIASLSPDRKGEYAQALDLAEKRYARLAHDQPETQKIKLSRYLQSRGFDWQTIYAVIDSVLKKE